jgi:hypothetical protein
MPHASALGHFTLLACGGGAKPSARPGRGEAERQTWAGRGSPCSAHPGRAAGPKERLDSTVVSQPAIYVASLAAVEQLRQAEGEARAPPPAQAPARPLRERTSRPGRLGRAADGRGRRAAALVAQQAHDPFVASLGLVEAGAAGRGCDADQTPGKPAPTA